MRTPPPRRLASAALALLLAASLAPGAPPAPEVEPDSFSEPAAPPQDLGTLDAGGLQVSGTSDPTSPDGLAPGDRDGFAFTAAADGDFSAVLDGDPAFRWVAALAREEGDGSLTILATAIGPAPLALAVPGLAAGVRYRVGVAGLGGGAPASYTLSLSTADALPAWTGETCSGITAEAEPDESVLEATDLGDFVRVLCGSGSLSSVVPQGDPCECEGDVDTFRFRNVLANPVRLALHAGPGQVRVEVQQLTFVGVVPVLGFLFGEEGTLDLPTLAPGQTYLVRITGEAGATPLAYDFHLEPVAAPADPPVPLAVERALLRLGPGPAASSFDVRTTFAPADYGNPSGSGLSYLVRGLEEDLGGVITQDPRGRLVYRAPKKTAGLRLMVLDPVLGQLRIRGKGADVAGDVDPTDPTVALEVRIGDLTLSGSAAGVFSRGISRLRVKPGL